MSASDRIVLFSHALQALAPLTLAQLGELIQPDDEKARHLRERGERPELVAHLASALADAAQEELRS